MKTISVGVCSASQVFVAGVTVWLGGLPDVDIVARCHTVADMQLVADASVVVVDGRATEEITLLFDMHDPQDRPEYVLLVDPGRPLAVPELVRAGVRGMLDPDCAEDELVGAIRAAAEGHLYVQRELIDQLVTLEPAHLTAQRSTVAGQAVRCDLTTRETEVWLLLAAGLPNEKIAESMDLSLRTVRFHTSNLYRKLGVPTRGEAIALAYRPGIRQ